MGVVRHLLHINMEELDKERRENIFHTWFGIKSRIWLTIIYNDSCANMASAYAVEKSRITCIKCKENYKIQWLNECKEIKVRKQWLISFSIGEYSDEVLYDAIPMQACHILLDDPNNIIDMPSMIGGEIIILLNIKGRTILLHP